MAKFKISIESESNYSEEPRKTRVCETDPIKNFNLYKYVKEEAMKVEQDKLDSMTPTAVNEAVMNYQKTGNQNDFIKLLILFFRKWDIELKINDSYYKGNILFLQREDYFQDYAFILYKCVMTYNPEIANFRNYFINSFRVHFQQIMKSSYLHMNGSLSLEERKKRLMKMMTFDPYNDYIGMHSGFGNRVMDDQVHTLLKKFLTEEECDLINYIWFSGPDVKTLKEASFVFQMPISTIHYKLDRAYGKIRKQCPTLLEDYCYDKDSYVMTDDVSVDESSDITVTVKVS